MNLYTISYTSTPFTRPSDFMALGLCKFDDFCILYFVIILQVDNIIMCFSENISLFAFTIGVIGSILVVSLGKIHDKIWGYWFLFLSLMQMIDFFLWRNQTCDNNNYIISILGIIFNNLQPIVLGILILVINTKLSYQDINTILCILFVYLCVIVPYSWQCIVKTQCTLKNHNNHMDWKWNFMEYWIIVYFVYLMTCFLLFYWFVPVYGYLFAYGTLFTFIISYIFYSKEVGNMWCFFTIFLPIIYYIKTQVNL